jgi:hypothetical protein
MVDLIDDEGKVKVDEYERCDYDPIVYVFRYAFVSLVSV